MGGSVVEERASRDANAVLSEQFDELLPDGLGGGLGCTAGPGGGSPAEAVPGLLTQGQGGGGPGRGGGPGPCGWQGQGAVQGLVAQGIRPAVLLAADVAEGDRAAEPGPEGLGLLVQAAQLLALDPVFAVHLLDQQLAVAVEKDGVFGTQLEGVLQGTDQGG